MEVPNNGIFTELAGMCHRQRCELFFTLEHRDLTNR